MERLRGRPLLQERFLGLSTVLVDVQARLHDLDAEALLGALDREGPPLSREVLTFGGYLAQRETRIADGGLEGLRRAMAWLRERRPPEPGRRAICHGDFHPQNILSEGGVVTGVLDWPNALVADPAYDVASTRIILALTPIALSGVPAALRGVASFVRLMLVKRYLAGMRRRRPLDPAVLAYYEAASAMRGLVRTGEHRRRAGSAASPLDASAFGDILARHFARVTGVPPMLPPRAG
jgi:aminoglycoside phosphotransferase (APT) family kinase protein